MGTVRIALIVASLLVSALLAGCIECGYEDYANVPQRSLNLASTCQDARTGLCFAYVWRHAAYRTGLTAVPCDQVGESLRWRGQEDELVCENMRYIRADQTRDPDLCFGYILDDAGNQKSNLAYVPCDPVVAAQQAGRVSLETFRP